ncbi:hypothetical protein [Nonomuraea sp. NPDC049709]|uniref:2OG-Fe(II)-dependent halogenase WelO5 family protein n=1 Tax=Nonomuraea sp. NPDC049709 TaxID=3154736 RepID=UPI003447E8F8
MSSNDSHDPFFRVVTSPAFHRDHIADLLAGRCTAIRVSGFMPEAQCEEILQALLRAEFDSYGTERVYPSVMRFGVGVSDHRHEGKVTGSYWPAIEASRKAWSDLALPFDPWEFCRTGLASHWPGTVAVGRREGREMEPGVAREANQGFQVHFDDVTREFSERLLDANLVAQLAFNLYLSVPEEGGETIIWRHRWQPADEAHRLPRSYGYAQTVVGDAEQLEIKSVKGEALLFDPRLFHAVRPSQGERRIALGFAVGLTDTGDLLTWG